MPGRNFTDQEEAEIAKIYLAGKSARAIARSYGLSHHISIVSALKRQGIEQRSPPDRNRLYKFDVHAFDEIDNEEKAYWWGFLYADGNVHKRSLSFSQKAESTDDVLKLKKFLKSEHPIRKHTVKYKDKEYPQALLYVTDQYFADRLIELGIVPQRTGLPPFEHLPENLYRHWIRGHFDGDGSAAKPDSIRGPSIRFCGSEHLMCWVRDFISQQIGTNPNLKVSKHSISDIYYLTFSGGRVAPKVTKWLYKNATIYMSRKKKIVDNW